MEGTKIIQQLLRPTDTCVFVEQGYLLGLPSPVLKLFAVVKHEGTEEHALFLFDVDQLETPPTFAVDSFFPIRGSFDAQLQLNRSSQCQILLHNGEGSSHVLQLPYDTHTAVFISQLKKALHQYSNSTTSNSPSAFDWLQGYNYCRTGWDRFTKPGRSSTQKTSQTDDSSWVVFGEEGEGGREEDRIRLRQGFPETWPWSHIHTPNSDGSTDVARCETLLQDFDPLHSSQQKPVTVLVPPPVSEEETDELADELCALSVTKPTPENSPKLPKSANPFRESGDFAHSNPFAPPVLSTSDKKKDMRHCISDSNLQNLENEIALRSLDRLDPLVTRSEEDLSTALDTQRHCVASELSESCTLEQRPSSAMLEQRPSSTMLEQRPSSSMEALDKDDDDDDDVLDYKNRRTRSTESSPTMDERKQIRDNVLQFRKRLEFYTHSISKPSPSKVSMYSPDLSSRRKGRGRSTSKPPPLKAGWISRFQPGVSVPIPGMSARESIMQAELRQRAKEFCTPIQVRVFCGTWNVNGRMPPALLDGFLLEYETKEDHVLPDIIVVGFQELDLSAQCLVGGESGREEPWIEAVERTLKQAGKYLKLCAHRLVGIMLLVYIREGLARFVSDVEAESVATGLIGVMGNKGGVAVRFNLYHSSYCFVNSHFAAHVDEVEKRNQDYHSIMEKMKFLMADSDFDISQHDVVFWLGDLNYRIPPTAEMTTDLIKAYADSYQIPALLKHDQLLQEMEKEAVLADFTEAPIDFKPSYKYDPNTDNWDSSEKNRAPAWCDRVLYCGEGVLQLAYQSHPKMMSSDHKPVSAIYNTTVRVVIPDKEKIVLEDITWKLDKLENDTLPQVDLNVTGFTFENVKFKVPQTKKLHVTNTGQRPVHLSFIPKLDEKAYCKPWLDVKPSTTVIRPLEDLLMLFTVLVDEDTAHDLNSARDILEDILVLHLEKGKDFFITIGGNYLPSCFGSSLETLVQLHTYIREVPVAQLVDLSSSWEDCGPSPITHYTNTVEASKLTPPPLDIPKELFQMVDFIKRHGADKEGIFSEGGRQKELFAVRDMLDKGGRELPGSVPTVAAALISFLAALAEPVIPVRLHQRCMEGYSNLTLCKQVITQMPNVHRKTFVFLVTFMKLLLSHSEKNGLDPKVLASIFSEVLLRAPRRERKSKSRRALNAMNRKKANFIYQFIVNDLTLPYN